MSQPDLRIIVTCRRCGADVEWVTGGSRHHWQQACIVRCTECSWSGYVNVEIGDLKAEPSSAARERELRELERDIERDHRAAIAQSRQVIEEELLVS